MKEKSIVKSSIRYQEFHMTYSQILTINTYLGYSKISLEVFSENLLIES